MDPLCTFEVAGQRLALAGASVRETVEATPTTPVPRTPAFLLGLVNLRGQVLPVFDLALLVGSPSGRTGGERWLVVERGNFRFAVPATNIATTAYDPATAQEHPDSAAFPVLDLVVPTSTGRVSILSLDRLAATLAHELQFKHLVTS